MSDLQNFVESLKKSGKTEIFSEEDTRNLSVPQMEIMAGYLLQKFSSYELFDSKITNAVAQYMISQEEKHGQVILNLIKNSVLHIYVERIKNILKGERNK